jgi:GNAT superfamily N-acetyltransferase
VPAFHAGRVPSAACIIDLRSAAASLPRSFRLNPPIVVRAVEPADFPAWKPLWDGYNAFYGRHGPTALPEQITQTTWTRFFDAGEPVHALVAECAGELLGLTHYLYHRSTIQVGLSCYLQDLYTVEAARGRGVGRALIQAVYDRARQEGSPRVYWQTHESNAVAMQLYDKLAERSGFVVYRRMLQGGQ